MENLLRAFALACLAMMPQGLAAAEEGPRPVSWKQLAVAPSAAGLDVRLDGYLLPVDRENDLVYEFLLVPWAGACIHTAAPPPNQLVRVSLAEPFRLEEIYEAVTVSGRLIAAEERQQVLMIDGVKQLDSAYAIARATVVHTAGAPPPAGIGNPWRRLAK
ncbi:DUF3299 domain-containing protein [Mesorhizobium australicum]|uniref:DUF3299 domain-containing protein n=1 Tax=Mesorhizobium australicum TaxID=536018 RepID=A0A1X7PA03_9HYPH|nr:DUF3299 domain-containing protein [Mesorhizobium australicum]SMH47308.1 hypothetical protein SAMN02982922_3501 [Mesorhizobium australicum]